MTRIQFEKNKQREWFEYFINSNIVSKHTLAKICGVTVRTIRAWLHEDTTISENALLQICEELNVSQPEGIKRLDDYWYIQKGARKGALARMKLYGPPGSIESRRKGGIISQKRRHENPDKYLKMGCRVKKPYSILNPDENFAEFTGILLGDGSITDSQVRITVSNLVDKDYSKFIVELMKKLFKFSPSIGIRNQDNTINITLSGIGLVELLEKWGFKKGNKIRQQVNIPRWIMKNDVFKKACVRGLMDTDGGIYFHNHKVGGNKYRNIELCFTSFSIPLLNSVAKILKENKINYSLKKNRLFIYNLVHIKRYFSLFSTHNPKNIKKFGEVAEWPNAHAWKACITER